MHKQRVARHEVTQPLNQSYRLIPLTQGQNAIVDASDYEWLSQWNWTLSRNYAYRKDAYRKHIEMHRVILSCSDGETCDHANGNGLDNRRANLRKCTYQQNAWNQKHHRNSTYQFKGVRRQSKGCTWEFRLNIGGKEIRKSGFSSEYEAASAYDIEAKRIYGQFAHTNFKSHPDDITP